MKPYTRALVALAAYLLWAAYSMEQAGRAQEPVHPAPAGFLYCDGLPPAYGDDC